MAQIQVEEKNTEGLKREFVVKVPRTEIEKTLTAKLEQIGRSRAFPGFRPGKVPLQIVRQQFGAGIRGEVLDKMVSRGTQKALEDRKLKPAGEPQIELVTFAEDQDLEFKLAVEILPEITPGDFSKIVLERPTADVTDKAIDEAIQRIAKSVREPEIVEGRAAQMGDVVVVDFNGTVGGEERPGMKGQGHRLELGSKSFIDTFEEQLVGAKAGDKKTIKVKFPAEYHAAELSGKDAEFAVEVKEIRAQKPVELNDDLAKELGLDSLESLRARVKENIGAEHARVSRSIAKRRLMDKLAETHSFTVPQGMVDGEFQSIWQQVEAQKARGQLPAGEAKKSDEQLHKDYRVIAERRVRLGLLLSDVASKAKIGVSPAELRDAMMNEARRFPGQEKAVVDYYTQTPGALERLRAPLLEEKVVDHILAQTTVTDRPVSPEDLMKMPGEEE